LKKIDKSIGSLSNRLDRLGAADISENYSEIEYRYGLTEEEYEKLSLDERAIIRFNWTVSNILPYYKQEVMLVHNLTSVQYDLRTMEGDESIYLPQPNRKFQPTLYMHRIAAVLGLDYRQLMDKIAKGEVKDRIATAGSSWHDEDENAVF
jgi:hypothetical protein